jgi:hypothetical protein
MKVIFNTCFDSIICYIGKFYFEDFLNCPFELLGENHMKIITAGLFLAYFPKINFGLSNYLCVCVCVCPILMTLEPHGRFS